MYTLSGILVCIVQKLQDIKVYKVMMRILLLLLLYYFYFI